MHKTKIIAASFCGAVPLILYSYATGPDPRYTGAPGDQTCVSCHIGTALNGGGGNVQLTSSTGTTYTPGQQQTFTITIGDPQARVYGFQVTARLDSDSSGGQAGDFTAGTQQIVLCDNGRIKGANGCSSSSPVEFIEHNRPFSSNSINVAWTPPGSADAGTVTIYVAANAANGNGNESGDHIYTTSLQLSPVTSVSTAPTINSGGVASAAAFNANAGIAAGTWLEIFGSNLATTTRNWQSSDFNGSSAPASLEGVTVTIGGQNAFVGYVSPGQVNVQVPNGIPLGSGVSLVLTNAQGQTDPYVLQTADLAPALLDPVTFDPTKGQFAVAPLVSTDPSAVVYGGQAANVNGVSANPAKPGDIVTLYGIGFGPVTPDTGAGVIATQPATLTNPLTVLLGQTPANIMYSGPAQKFVGLYELDVEVPNVDPGTWTLVVQAGGITLNQNVTITTQ